MPRNNERQTKAYGEENIRKSDNTDDNGSILIQVMGLNLDDLWYKV
jgi:hypothetical protein